jgi:hypothetical protein
MRTFSFSSLQRLLPMAALLIMVSGCGRMNTFSEVKSDGTLVRTLTFRGASSEKPKPGELPSDPGGLSMMSGPAIPIEAISVIPTGTDWTITRKTKDRELIVTATKTVPPGTTITDDLGIRAEPDPKFMDGGLGEDSSLRVAPAPDPAPKPTPKPAPKPAAKPGTKPKSGTKPKGKPSGGKLHLALVAVPVRQAPQNPPVAPPLSTPPKLMLSNTVTVREIEPGKWEYKEVIRWNGPPMRDSDFSDKDAAEKLRKVMPPALQNDPGVARVTTNVQREIFSLIFGPGEPLLAQTLFHTELAEYRLVSRITNALDKALVAEFGTRLTEADRKTILAALVEDAANGVTDKTKKPPVGEKEGSSPMGNEMPIAMLFRVKMPGKVISTNGQYIPETGEVIWPMYSMAPAFGEVTLTAICEK